MPMLKEEDLTQFTGSENWYRHALAPHITYTDGAKYLADNGGAYWLLDTIALHNAYGDPAFKREELIYLWRNRCDKMPRCAIPEEWRPDTPAAEPN